MFDVGTEYRVFFADADRLAILEGTLIAYSHPLIALDCAGVRTTFSLDGGRVAYVETVDRDAEHRRQEERHQAWVSAFNA